MDSVDTEKAKVSLYWFLILLVDYLYQTSAF